LASLLLALGILVGFFILFVWIARRTRKGGGGTTVSTLGAAHNLLNRDQKKAAEIIVETHAGKQMEEDESADPPVPGGRSG
jgi:hypothetical protein